LPAQYRARAEEARKKAEGATDEAIRKSLVSDAEMYERMAPYEEKIDSRR